MYFPTSFSLELPIFIHTLDPGFISNPIGYERSSPIAPTVGYDMHVTLDATFVEFCDEFWYKGNSIQSIVNLEDFISKLYGLDIRMFISK
ncbi:hypothetical protein Lal_00012057 [Lupinus albus]|nr:hypothetical protein Lal_00012057 [Lupinus albus]